MLLIADVKLLLVPFALAFLIVLASRLVDDEGPAVGAPTSFSGPPLAAASMRRVACSTAVAKLPTDVPPRSALFSSRPIARSTPFCPRRSSRIFRSEEHTSELQSLMRISYAVFCLKKKK